MSSFEKSEAWRLGHLTIIARSPICFIVAPEPPFLPLTYCTP
jgi:hypothetical protein